VLPLLSLRRRIESLTPKQIVLLVFVIAFLIRLAFLATKPHAFTHQLQAGDEPVYHGIAANLAEGQGYVYDGQPTARYGPGYPVFIAAIYRTFGVNPVFGRFGNVVLGALLCVDCFMVNEDLGSERRDCFRAFRCLLLPVCPTPALPYDREPLPAIVCCSNDGFLVVEQFGRSF